MIKKYLKYIKESITTDVEIEKGDYILYKFSGDESFGQIDLIRTIFFSYDRIEIDYIVSDLKNNKCDRIDYKDIIRKLTDFEIASIKYNL